MLSCKNIKLEAIKHLLPKLTCIREDGTSLCDLLTKVRLDNLLESLEQQNGQTQ